MNARGTNAVRGRVTANGGAGRMWHTDPNCDEMDGPSTACAGKSVAELVHNQAEKGRSCCRKCTVPAILDDAFTRASGTGYHALTCADWHGTGPSHPLGRGACTLCAALARYADGTEIPAGLAGGHVTLLRPGNIEGAEGYLREAMIEIRNTSGGGLPHVDGAMWKTAAELMGAHGLGQGLEVAAAVHGPQLRR